MEEAEGCWLNEDREMFPWGPISLQYLKRRAHFFSLFRPRVKNNSKIEINRVKDFFVSFFFFLCAENILKKKDFIFVRITKNFLIMKKKLIMLTASVAISAMIVMNVMMYAQSGKISDVTLSELTAKAGDATDDQTAEGSAEACVICGNCTFIPESELRLKNCFFGLAGQHLKCVNSDMSCCNPADQTPCEGIL